MDKTKMIVKTKYHRPKIFKIKLFFSNKSHSIRIDLLGIDSNGISLENKTRSQRLFYENKKK